MFAWKETGAAVPDLWSDIFAYMYKSFSEQITLPEDKLHIKERIIIFINTPVIIFESHTHSYCEH